jgi:hypothetical protein
VSIRRACSARPSVATPRDRLDVHGMEREERRDPGAPPDRPVIVTRTAYSRTALAAWSAVFSSRCAPAFRPKSRQSSASEPGEGIQYAS